MAKSSQPNFSPFDWIALDKLPDITNYGDNVKSIVYHMSNTFNYIASSTYNTLPHRVSFSLFSDGSITRYLIEISAPTKSFVDKGGHEHTIKVYRVMQLKVEGDVPDWIGKRDSVRQIKVNSSNPTEEKPVIATKEFGRMIYSNIVWCHIDDKVKVAIGKLHNDVRDFNKKQKKGRSVVYKTYSSNTYETSIEKA